MRNLVYLNGDGMINVHPKVDTVQINDDYYCEMGEKAFQEYLSLNGLHIGSNGQLLDNDDNYSYGLVLVAG